MWICGCTIWSGWLWVGKVYSVGQSINDGNTYFIRWLPQRREEVKPFHSEFRINYYPFVLLLHVRISTEDFNVLFVALWPSIPSIPIDGWLRSFSLALPSTRQPPKWTIYSDLISPLTLWKCIYRTYWWNWHFTVCNPRLSHYTTCFAAAKRINRIEHNSAKPPTRHTNDINSIYWNWKKIISFFLYIFSFPWRFVIGMVWGCFSDATQKASENKITIDFL